MALCRTCEREKPDSQVSLGICDDCFSRPAKPRSAADIDRENGVILTTSIDVPNRKTDAVVAIVAAEVALGLNVFRDLANSIRDFVGGRSSTSENALRDARSACLRKLKEEAEALGADAVIAVSLNYNEISTSGAGILFVAATGTAVRLAPRDAI